MNNETPTPDSRQDQISRLQRRIDELQAQLEECLTRQGEVYSLYAEMLYVLTIEVYSYSVLYKWPGSEGLARDLLDRLLLAEMIQGREIAPYPTTLAAALKLWFPRSRLYRVAVIRGLVRGTYRGVRFVGRALRGRK